jgi:2'-5' RNA ligase
LNQATQRLFFALWPEAGLQKALHRYAQSMEKSFGGRVIAADSIHLTLAFLGSVPVERIGELRAIGASLRSNRFQLDLVKAGRWKRSQIAWVAPENVPAPLDALVLKLRDHLAGAGFTTDDKPFTPHITLVRNAKCNIKAVQSDIPLIWSVDRFVLVRSETLQTGPVYTQLATWALND